ncbi:MAG TPA: GDSL-type esterase/lipase family protein, partial [Polyangiaceae bacterium]|nr:GDSL-type esterase/lipase family protein [Polyangiaceae bacterium]
LLHIGTNNIYQGMPADLPGQLDALLDQITTGAPDALVVVAQITPVATQGAQFTFPNNGVDVYNATIPAVVQEHVDAGQHLILVNMNAAFRANPNFVSLLSEGLHPNDTGYGVMADTWYQAIESFLP